MIPPGIISFMMLDGIILDRGSRVSLRRQLTGHLESRILGGQISPGRKLPSVRRVEELLGLHRNTVSAAYRDLVHSGLARTRPGSGVYARSPSDSSCASVAVVTACGVRDAGLDCADRDLRSILSAELRSRLAVRVQGPSREGPSVRIRLAPGMALPRAIRELPRPSVVCLVSSSEVAHRLVSNAVLVHGGEGVAFLPTSTGNRNSLAQASRLASLVVSDYASLSWARRLLSGRVVPLPLISAFSWTELSFLLRSREPVRPAGDRRRKRVERSLQTGVDDA